MLAQRIKVLRLERELTQAELARKTQRSAEEIQSYENGEINHLTNEDIAILAIALEVSPVFLMGFTDVRNPF